MGKSKTAKRLQALKVDQPGPDDFTYLAVFFPVGRNGVALAKDSNPEDQQAAARIATWMHLAGLPIRKLFSRRSEEHVLVEVREEVPQDVIEAKLGAYKWTDMLHGVLPTHVNAESMVMRAKVRSHDAVEKMGGMVCFYPPRIVPDENVLSRFKQPFPQPRKHDLMEPSKFSAIKYIPLLPQLTFSHEEDVKPRIADEETKPDIKFEEKPDVKSGVKLNDGPDTKPDTKPDLQPEPDQERKPNEALKEEFRQYKLKNPGPIRPSADMNIDDIDYKPKLEAEVQSEVTDEIRQNQALKEEFRQYKLANPGPIRPSADMNIDDIDYKPNVEAEAEAETEPRAIEGAYLSVQLEPIGLWESKFGLVVLVNPDTEANQALKEEFRLYKLANPGPIRPSANMNIDDVDYKPDIETEPEPEPEAVDAAPESSAQPGPSGAQPTLSNRDASEGGGVPPIKPETNDGIIYDSA
ncbi:hypothetical protein FRC12_006065 [Ceratobasidium sp. 428]|nr:hypothetical protein FRC12_006065 [Ceratobasidium sp. 428]